MDERRYALSPAESRKSVAEVGVADACSVDGEEDGPGDDRHRGEEDHEQAQEAEEHVRVHSVLVQLQGASCYRKCEAQ